MISCNVSLEVQIWKDGDMDTPQPSNEGLIVIWNQEKLTFATINTEGFDDNAAKVVCRKLGYTTV